MAKEKTYYSFGKLKKDYMKGKLPPNEIVLISTKDANTSHYLKDLFRDVSIQTKKIVSDIRHIAGKKAWQTKKARQYFKVHPEMRKEAEKAWRGWK